jgi:putative sterol carrier protein
MALLSKSSSHAEPMWGTYRVPSLRGVNCDIEWTSPNTRAHMHVEDGAVTLSPKKQDAQCWVEAQSDEDLLSVLNGELNVVAATLQGRMIAQGDLLAAVRVAGSLRDLGSICSVIHSRKATS